MNNPASSSNSGISSVGNNPAGSGNEQIGIIISMFPELHETFILRELTALKRRGVNFTIYSLQYPRDPITLQDARYLSEKHTVYSRLLTVKTLTAFARAALRHPLKMAKVMARVCINGYDRPLDVIKALAILPVTLYFGEHARARGIQHLHGHWANVPTTACWYLGQIDGFSWSAAIHGEDIFSANRFLPYKLDDATFSVVCSGYFCRHLQQEIGLKRPSDVHLNYHGLDPRVMKLAADKLFKAPDADGVLRLVSIGRMVPTKGHDTLLQACGHLRNQHKIKFELQLIGSGPEQESLVSMAASLGIEDAVVFRGGLAFEDVLATLQQSDVFCLAPRLIPGHPPDGIPNVIAEAMALRLPVVTTRVSAIPELIEHETSGLLVEVDDDLAMAEALAAIATDSALAERLAEEGFAKVSDLFNQDQNIDELLQLFEQYTGYVPTAPVDEIPELSGVAQ